VAFHFSTRVPYSGLMFHGYLAVDVFFLLSRYVIFQSYNAQIAGRSLCIRQIISIRLVRIMPLIFLGNAVAAVIDTFRPGGFSFTTHLTDIADMFVAGCFLLPTFRRTTLEDTTYPLNGPIWSPFFELFANLVFFAIAQYRTSRSQLWLITAISLGALAAAAMKTDGIHFGPHADLFVFGFARVLFSFRLGCLPAFVKFERFRLKPWQCVALLIAEMAAPRIEDVKISAAFDLCCIALVNPWIIGAAACYKSGTKIDGFARCAGTISYPLYCVHYPLMRVLAAIMRHFRFWAVGNILLSIVLAGVLCTLALLLDAEYDKPVRRRLTSLLARRPSI
jgi:peptidoglycan/LPS O-acetylase OafA/YrhL